MPNQEQQIEVTQEDRDAAADYEFSRNGYLAERGIRDGQKDASAIVQAFARHRIQALEKAAATVAAHADDRGGRDRPLDWHDGYIDGCQGAAAAVYALSQPKEPGNVG